MAGAGNRRNRQLLPLGCMQRQLDCCWIRAFSQLLLRQSGGNSHICCYGSQTGTVKNNCCNEARCSGSRGTSSWTFLFSPFRSFRSFHPFTSPWTCRKYSHGIDFSKKFQKGIGKTAIYSDISSLEKKPCFQRFNGR